MTVQPFPRCGRRQLQDSGSSPDVVHIQTYSKVEEGASFVNAGVAPHLQGPVPGLCCCSLQSSKASLTCPPGYRDCIRGVGPHARHAGLLFHNVSAMLHHITHWHQPSTWPWTWAAAWAQWCPHQLATSDCWYALPAILHSQCSLNWHSMFMIPAAMHPPECSSSEPARPPTSNDNG